MLKSKTTWTGIAALIGIAGAYFSGNLDIAQAAESAFVALQTIFLRHAIKKGTGS